MKKKIGLRRQGLIGRLNTAKSVEGNTRVATAEKEGIHERQPGGTKADPEVGGIEGRGNARSGIAGNATTVDEIIA